VVDGGTEAGPSLSPAPSGERSRRALLGGGSGALAAGAALLLAGCTSKVKTASHVPLTPQTPGAQQDVELLNALLHLENRSIAAYTACIPLLPQPAPPPTNQSKPSSPPPPPSKQPPPPLVLMVPLAYTAAQTFLTQELAHVRELAGFVHQAGGRAVKPDVSYDLGHPKTKQDALTLLHETEQELLDLYLRLTPLFTPKELRGAAAAIFANHAQHSSILRFQLGLTPIPGPFVSEPE
jgi:hypothetical protein